MSDERLAILSDKVRKGEPIGFVEALEVIEYQEKLNEYRKENSVIEKFKKFFKRIYRGTEWMILIWQ